MRQVRYQMLPPIKHLKIYLLLKIEKNSPTGKALTSQWGPAVIKKNVKYLNTGDRKYPLDSNVMYCVLYRTMLMRI